MSSPGLYANWSWPVSSWDLVLGIIVSPSAGVYAFIGFSRTTPAACSSMAGSSGSRCSVPWRKSSP